MLYVPTVMLYFVGVSVFAMGPGHAALADNKAFAMVASFALLTLLTLLNIVGLGVGKWLNNVGAIGTFVAAAVLIGLGNYDLVALWHDGHGGRPQNSPGPQVRPELFRSDLLWAGRTGTGFGHGRRNPRSAENVAGRGRMGRRGFRIALHRSDADPAGRHRQERHQRAARHCTSVSQMAGKVGVAWIVAPFAVMLSFSIAGIGSAWMGGSARIPFVAGLDSYMPAAMGKVHPKYSTPHVALIVQGIVSLILIVLNFYSLRRGTGSISENALGAPWCYN